MKEFEIIVIGGGPGGYVAAIQAAKAGSSVALVEAEELGGTCLNRGCIPSKTLLRHAEVIELIKKASSWGINTGEVTFSLQTMMERKSQVIKRLRTGIGALLKKNKIEVFRGIGTVHPDKTVLVQTEDGEATRLQGKSIILATGSKPLVPGIKGIDQIQFHTSDTIFDIQELPKSLAIIGGGVIGVEFACIFVHLNVEVTVIEMADRLIPTEDPEASRALKKALEDKGVRVLTGYQVQAFSPEQEQKAITMLTPDKHVETSRFDQVLVAVGRKPNMSGLESLGLRLAGAYIEVDSQLMTSIPDIYAVGDVIGGYQLAHVASAEGGIAAHNATQEEKQAVDYRVVPRCIYTFPEVASVGMNEMEAERLGYNVQKAVYPLKASGKAMAMDETEGFIKIIADKKYGEVLGVVIVGPHATEMISEASTFIYMEGTVEEIAGMIHPHPTLSEGLFEGAAALAGMGVHM